jgi:hypothetical protein
MTNPFLDCALAALAPVWHGWLLIALVCGVVLAWSVLLCTVADAFLLPTAHPTRFYARMSWPDAPANQDDRERAIFDAVQSITRAR